MIGATRFVGAYGSFWKNVTPTIDLFVRQINLDLYERVEPPAEYQVDPARSALVAETAFALFDQQSRHDGIEENFFDDFIELAEGEAQRRLALLNIEHIVDSLNAEELDAAGELFRRLSSFFTEMFGRELIVRPIFPGCGFIDRSEGDVIYDDTLFEVKTVERNFRASDVKQLITYAALNSKSESYSIRGIGIYNPKRGTKIVLSLDDVCMEISGVSAIELLETVIYSVASGEVSR